jgi:hypothetical protein
VGETGKDLSMVGILFVRVDGICSCNRTRSGYEYTLTNWYGTILWFIRYSRKLLIE